MTGKNYAQHVAEDRRLCILRLLIEGKGVSPESILEIGLRSLGHHAMLDRAYVREQLKFLETAGLITIEMVNDKVMVAHITGRGASVANGAIDCEGVKAPGFD